MGSYRVVLKERTSISGNRYYVATLAEPDTPEEPFPPPPNEEKLAHLQEECRRLTEENNALSRQLHAQTELIAQLTQEKEEQEARNRLGEEQRTTLMAEKRRLTEEMDTLRRQLAARTQTVKENEERISALQKEIAALKAKIRKLEAKTNRLLDGDSLDAMLGKCRLEEILGKMPSTQEERVRLRNEVLKQFHPDKVHHLGPALRDICEAIVKAINAKFPSL